ncbi:hypothetical protein J6590_027890 [Homalodisca vitripennis]|nr:hypothetical protein J6590_027890 [Homalodisca vitripennis]
MKKSRRMWLLCLCIYAKKSQHKRLSKLKRKRHYSLSDDPTLQITLYYTVNLGLRASLSLSLFAFEIWESAAAKADKVVWSSRAHRRYVRDSEHFCPHLHEDIPSTTTRIRDQATLREYRQSQCERTKAATNLMAGGRVCLSSYRPQQPQEGRSPHRMWAGPDWDLWAAGGSQGLESS